MAVEDRCAADEALLVGKARADDLIAIVITLNANSIQSKTDTIVLTLRSLLPV